MGNFLALKISSGTLFKTSPQLPPPNIQQFFLKRISLGWPAAAPFCLAHHFPKTFSGWLSFCAGKKNIFGGEIVLEFK